MGINFKGVITDFDTCKKSQTIVTANTFEGALDKMGDTWYKIDPKKVVVTNLDNNKTRSFTRKKIHDIFES